LLGEEETDEAGAPLISILRPKQPNSDPALDKAQQIMYDAWEEPRPARRIALAKKALKTSPNCADAYVLLAVEDAKTLEESLALYQSGVQAGRRALGEDFFNDPGNIGHFWGILETRPFMRAMQGLASIQWELGQPEEAERNFRELLRLNPGDNQGIRFMLLNLLMELGQDDQARALLKEYPDDWTAESVYTAALLAFREKGDSPEARQALKKAAKMNKHAPAYLTGKKQIPLVQPDFITVGESDEAAGYAAEYLKYWRETPGAIEWLEKMGQKRK
jgi:tetratricopeptide (TPR) repeat protein